MSSAIKTVSRPGPQSTADVVRSLHSLLGRLALAYEVYRERRTLLGMCDDALKDIGLSRADAYCEGQRAPWDLPANR